MPHRGEASSSRCGTPGFKAHFDRETHWVRFNHDCKEYDCGICKSEARAEGGYIVRGWECREALSIVERLEAFQDQHSLGTFPVHSYWSGIKQQRRRDVAKPRPYHVVISPPQVNALPSTVQGYRRMWKRLYEVAKSRGIIGGVAIFHPARIPSRFNKRSCEAPGPHFHVLGFTFWGDAWDGEVVKILHGGGSLVGRTALHARLVQLKQATGATEAVAGDKTVVKLLPSAKRSIFATAAYVLSHAARPIVGEEPEARWRAYPASPHSSGEIERQSRHFLGTVPHWFGALSYNKLQVPETEPGRFCETCKRLIPMDEWFDVEPVEEPPPDQAYGRSPIDMWELPLELELRSNLSVYGRRRLETVRENFDACRAVRDDDAGVVRVRETRRVEVLPGPSCPACQFRVDQRSDAGILYVPSLGEPPRITCWVCGAVVRIGPGIYECEIE